MPQARRGIGALPPGVVDARGHIHLPKDCVHIGAKVCPKMRLQRRGGISFGVFQPEWELR